MAQDIPRRGRGHVRSEPGRPSVAVPSTIPPAAARSTAADEPVSQSRARQAAERPVWPVWVAGLLLFGALESALLLSPEFARLFGNVTLILAVAGVAVCARAGLGGEVRARSSWLLVSASCLSLLLGLVLQRWLVSVSSASSVSLLDDLALLAPAPLLTLATVLRVEGEFPWMRRVKLLVDAVLCSAAIGTTMLLAAYLEGEHLGGLAARGLSLVYLAAYSGLLYGVAVTLRRSGWQPMTSPQGSFALGTTALAGAAVLFGARLDLSTLGFPAVGASLWGASLVFFTLGGLSAVRHPLESWGIGGSTSETREESRLRILPAMAATILAVWLASADLRAASHLPPSLLSASLGLSALAGYRLLLALLENRLLQGQVRTAGQFEQRLRDLGIALNSSLDPERVLLLVCRAGLAVLKADTVIIWMLDREAQELDAVEVAGPRRQEVRGRRLQVKERSSLAVRVLVSGEPEVVQDAVSSRRANQFLAILMRAQCLLAVPITKGKTRIGVIEFADSQDREAFHEEHVAKAELLAAQAAVAIENARLYDQVRQQLEVVSAQLEFADAANQAVTPDEIAHRLLRTLRKWTAVSRARVFLCESSGILPRLVAEENEAPGSDRPSRLSDVAMAALKAGEPRRRTVELPREAGRRAAPLGHSELAVPLSANDRTIGLVALERPDPDGFTAHHERLVVSLANHAALGMSNLVLLEQARKVEALKALDRMKSELLSIVSHELRTPLGSIKGYTSTLLNYDRKLSRIEKQEFLHIIDEESDRLRELIENLLDMSRLEAGMLRIDKARVRLRAAAEEVLHRATLRETGHVFRLDWSEDIDVDADARRLSQVLHNLVENAVKYSPDGGEVVVEARVQGTELAVSVHDHGIGIERDDLERVFDRFHRVDSETGRRVGGTGLGLAICRGIVEAHGGCIRVQSRVGLGSTFTFTIPLGSE